MNKKFIENQLEIREKGSSPNDELLEVTSDSDTRETLFRLVEMLRKQGISVTPAPKGSLLKRDA